jgi:hypothetical protein
VRPERVARTAAEIRMDTQKIVFLISAPENWYTLCCPPRCCEMVTNYHQRHCIAPSRGTVQARHPFLFCKEAKDMAISKRLMTSVVLLCAAALIAGCGNSSTSPEEVTEAPLLPPTSLVITRAGNGNILISWDMSTQPTLNGYNVYRAVGSSTTYTKLNSSLIQSNQYLDTTTDYDILYKFHVSAVNSHGVESRFASVQLLNTFNVYGSGGDKTKAPQL